MEGTWREVINENLEVLSQSTAVHHEMSLLLYTYGLITQSDSDLLMNPAKTDHERAITLYTKIAQTWNDMSFEKFKLVLRETRNMRAFEILNIKNQEGFRKTVNENLATLVECTAVNDEMTAELLQRGLISSSESHKIRSTSSPYEKAIMLYTHLSSKWDDEGFQQFIRALEVSKNDRALRILNKGVHERSTSLEPQGDPVTCVTKKNLSLSDMQIQLMEARGQNLQFREEMKFLVNNLRAHFTTMIDHIGKDLREEFKSNILHVENKARTDIAVEGNSVVNGLRGDLRADVNQLRNDLKVQIESIWIIRASAKEDQSLSDNRLSFL